MKIGDIVEDLVDDLGKGRILDIYLNRYCGSVPVTMLTVDFGDDRIFDRLPTEVTASAPQSLTA